MKSFTGTSLLTVLCFLGLQTGSARAQSTCRSGLFPGLWAESAWELQWNPSLGSVVVSNTFSAATAFALSNSTCNCGICSDCPLQLGYEFDSNSSASYNSGAAVITDTDGQGVVHSEAQAFTAVPIWYDHPDHNEMGTYTGVCYVPNACEIAATCGPWCPECPTYQAFPAGFGDAWATAVYPWVFDPYEREPRTDAWTATMSVTASADFPDEGVDIRLWRAVFLLYDGPSAPAVLYLMHAGEHTAGEGLTFNSGTGQWTGELATGGGAGAFEHKMRRMTFEDEGMDVDSDGRFNEIDVDALILLDGSTNELDLFRWDFNGNSVIDSTDADFMQELVELDLDSGVFGDLDGDSQRDCGAIDTELYDSHLGLTDYHIEVDYNLDGVTDASDRAALIAEWTPDCDADGTPDECEIPAATVVSAVTRKNCDLALIPGVKSEPRQGGISEVRVSFDVPLVCPVGTPITLDQKSCPAPGTYASYSGSSVASTNIAGSELVLSFSPSLENLRTYRINIGSAVTSIAGQYVEIRGLVGDVNSSGTVNGGDQSAVVGVWTGSGFTCATDITNNGVTNGGDKSVVVGAWTGGANCAP